MVPTRPGDAPGTGPLYVVLSRAVAAYFMVVTMQRAVGFGRLAHVTTSVGWGAVAATVSYLAAVHVVQVIPPHPLALLYLFLLTQAVSLTAYGLVPCFGGFSPGIAVTLSSCSACPAAEAPSPSSSCQASSGSAPDPAYGESRRCAAQRRLLRQWPSVAAHSGALRLDRCRRHAHPARYRMQQRRLAREAAGQRPSTSPGLKVPQ